MRDAMTALQQWWASGRTVGLATVVRTFRSAPQPPGAAMVVGPDGEAVGSVSGGCVEGAVYELAAGVRDGAPPVLQRYGVSDDDAFSVGLTCGGILDVFVERVSTASFPQLGALLEAVTVGHPIALATVVGGRPDQVGRRLLVRPASTDPTAAAEDLGGLGGHRLDDAVRDDARGLLAGGRTGLLTYGPDGQRRGEGLSVFVHSHAPPPRMLVFGAIDFAAAVGRLGAFLGYRVTVCDARPVFSTAARFPDAHEVITDWPHRYLRQQAEAGLIDPRTVICVLTHDPKFDVPVLLEALRLDVAYVGAMGSRRTADERAEQLRAAGLSELELAGLASPIGLDLGARTPEETAVSIAAEIVARRWGGGGHPLHSTAGDIHRPDSGDRQT